MHIGSAMWMADEAATLVCSNAASSVYSILQVVKLTAK